MYLYLNLLFQSLENCGLLLMRIIQQIMFFQNTPTGTVHSILQVEIENSTTFNKFNFTIFNNGIISQNSDNFGNYFIKLLRDTLDLF